MSRIIIRRTCGYRFIKNVSIGVPRRQVTYLLCSFDWIGRFSCCVFPCIINRNTLCAEPGLIWRQGAQVYTAQFMPLVDGDHKLRMPVWMTASYCPRPCVRVLTGSCVRVYVLFQNAKGAGGGGGGIEGEKVGKVERGGGVGPNYTHFSLSFLRPSPLSPFVVPFRFHRARRPTDRLRPRQRTPTGFEGETPLREGTRKLLLLLLFYILL